MGLVGNKKKEEEQEPTPEVGRKTYDNMTFY